LPELIFYEHDRTFGAEQFELTYVAVPNFKFDPVPEVTTLPDDMPAWVRRRIAPYLDGPNSWPDFPPASNGNVCHSVLDIEIFGWPRPALWFGSYVQRPFSGSGPRPGWIAEGAVRVFGRARAGTAAMPLYLPTHPNSPGLIIDTIVWSTPFFLAMSWFAKLRRARRIKRGQCSTCAYDLRATPPGSPCPECGGTQA
jgi:hypothetical protein